MKDKKIIISLLNKNLYFLLIFILLIALFENINTKDAIKEKRNIENKKNFEEIFQLYNFTNFAKDHKKSKGKIILFKKRLQNK